MQSTVLYGMNTLNAFVKAGIAPPRTSRIDVSMRPDEFVTLTIECAITIEQWENVIYELRMQADQ